MSLGSRLIRLNEKQSIQKYQVLSLMLTVIVKIKICFIAYYGMLVRFCNILGSFICPVVQFNLYLLGLADWLEFKDIMILYKINSKVFYLTAFYSFLKEQQMVSCLASFSVQSLKDFKVDANFYHLSVYPYFVFYQDFYLIHTIIVIFKLFVWFFIRIIPIP